MPIATDPLHNASVMMTGPAQMASIVISLGKNAGAIMTAIAHMVRNARSLLRFASAEMIPNARMVKNATGGAIANAETTANADES